MRAWWRRRAGIRVRSAAAAVLVVVLALALASVGLVVTLDRVLAGSSRDAALSRAADVRDILDEEGVVGLEPGPRFSGEDIVQVLSPDGTVISSPSIPGATRPITDDLPARAGVTVHTARDVPGSAAPGPFVVVTSSVIDPGNGAELVIVVARSTARDAETTATVERLVAVGAPLLALVVAWVTWVFTGRSLAPVAAIRSQVATIDAADLSNRVPVPAAHDEIARLAETMNTMLGRLERAQRTQHQFIADASHELRSPLATLSVAVETSRRRATGDWAGVLETMSAEVARMSDLVADLVMMVTVDEQGRVSGVEDVDLDHLVEAEAARLRAHGAIAVSVSSQPLRVVGNRRQLAQVVRNLVDNAARHATSRLSIELGRDEAGGRSQAVLVVTDDGPGIAVADRERVFERFVRLDDSRARGTGGSGLGLAIVRQVVLAHGGQVAVIGGASRFEVRLPAPDRPRPEASDPQASAIR